MQDELKVLLETMDEEEPFTEDTVEDVEGCVRNFFLGCLRSCGSEDPEIINGKLFGQDYESIRKHCKKNGELFIDDHFPSENQVAGKTF